MPTQIRVERSMAAPPEHVFAVATDIQRFPEVVPKIVKVELLTPGPMAVGTRFRETRRFLGREASEEMQVVGFDPPRSYTLGAESHGCRYRTVLRFEREGAGTRVSMEFGAEPLTFTAKVLSVLMKPMLKKMVEMCAEDLEAIKAHVERGA